MTDWAHAIPLVTLLTVVAAAGGLWVRVGRLAVDVRDMSRLLAALDKRQDGADLRAVVTETKVEDLISQFKRIRRSAR